MHIEVQGGRGRRNAITSQSWEFSHDMEEPERWGRVVVIDVAGCKVDRKECKIGGEDDAIWSRRAGWLLRQSDSRVLTAGR